MGKKFDGRPRNDDFGKWRQVCGKMERELKMGSRHIYINI
jgi:hypothetical protein